MKRKRLSQMPFVLFLSILCLAPAGCASKHESRNNPNPSGKPALQAETVRVRVAPVVVRSFEDTIVVQGNLASKNYANVTARIPGTIVGMYVREGDLVTAARTKLFAVDSIKLSDAVEISRQDFEVARQGVNVAEAGLEQVDTQLKKARTDLKRITSLYEQDVVTTDTLEKAQTGFDQVTAARKQASSALTLSKERLRQAEIALKIARKNLSDATIFAPISGSVSNRFNEVGEMAVPGAPIIRIEDTSLLEASAFLPAEAYDRVLVGKTPVRLSLSGIDIGTKTVSYKSPTINPKLRTFEVKAVISSPPPGVVPGAMADFRVILADKSSIGVPSASIQLRGGKNVVFVASGGKARKRVVHTGLETNGYTEIITGVHAGDSVVTEGQNFLDDGSPITIGGEAQ